MAKVFAILYEPADYTLDLIRNIYIPRGMEWCFVYKSSKASADTGELTQRPVLSEMGRWARLRYFWKMLKTHDAFVANGWTLRPNLEFFFLDWLFFRKPLAWESDTELSVPNNPTKRAVKWLWLGTIFRRRFCYGFPGGSHRQKALFLHYGMTENRIVLMPMVIDNDCYRRGFKSSGSRFKFVFVGRLIALKQVDKIIAALPENCDLVVIGDGEERARLELAAHGNLVEFAGALFGADKIRKMHEADCLVLYSTHDQWGFVVNEALASGMPVIVSNQVGCRYDLVEGDMPAGLVAKWDDVRDLSDKMRQMSENRELYRKLSENAVERMKHWDYGFYGSQLDAWINAAVI